jgi:hypothetical protein
MAGSVADTATGNGRGPDIQTLYREYLEEAQTKLDDAVEAVERVEAVSPRGSFADRVASTRVDLVRLMGEDPQPPAPIAGSGGVLLQGVAHLWPMERKAGKSIAMLVTAVDIVLAGGTVAILDRENGEKRTALRLKDIADARKLTADHLEQVRERLHYFAFPRIRPGDESDLRDLFQSADLVVYDSSRTFLASQNLKEDSSDDYADFMAATIEPLKEAGIATLILDNSGWSDGGRPRGTSSKEDLNEHLFKSEKAEPFDRETTGMIILEVKESRDGLTGTWTMRIGGGVYDSWQEADEGVTVGKKGKQSTEKAERLDAMRALLADDPSMSDDDLAAKLDVNDRTIRRYRQDLVLASV